MIFFSFCSQWRCTAGFWNTTQSVSHLPPLMPTDPGVFGVGDACRWILLIVLLRLGNGLVRRRRDIYIRDDSKLFLRLVCWNETLQVTDKHMLKMPWGPEAGSSPKANWQVKVGEALIYSIHKEHDWTEKCARRVPSCSVGSRLCLFRTEHGFSRAFTEFPMQFRVIHSPANKLVSVCVRKKRHHSFLSDGKTFFFSSRKCSKSSVFMN